MPIINITCPRPYWHNLFLNLEASLPPSKEATVKFIEPVARDIERYNVHVTNVPDETREILLGLIRSFQKNPSS